MLFVGNLFIAITFQIAAKETDVVLATVNLRWTLGMPRKRLFQVWIVMFGVCIRYIITYTHHAFQIYVN